MTSDGGSRGEQGGQSECNCECPREHTADVKTPNREGRRDNVATASTCGARMCELRVQGGSVTVRMHAARRRDQNFHRDFNANFRVLCKLGVNQFCEAMAIERNYASGAHVCTQLRAGQVTVCGRASAGRMPNRGTPFKGHCHPHLGPPNNDTTHETKNERMLLGQGEEAREWKNTANEHKR